MTNGIVLTMLAVETVSDIRTKSVSVIRIGIFLAAAIIYNVLRVYQPIWSMLGGMAIGIILLGYAIVTREGIGYGDGLIFISIGAYIGLSSSMRLLLFSLIMAAVLGGIYALIHKKSIKTKIPFVPFVFATYIIMTIVEVTA